MWYPIQEVRDLFKIISQHRDPSSKRVTLVKKFGYEVMTIRETFSLFDHIYIVHYTNDLAHARHKTKIYHNGEVIVHYKCMFVNDEWVSACKSRIPNLDLFWKLAS